MNVADSGPIGAKGLESPSPCIALENRRMALEREIESKFTGMIFLLRRVLPETVDGRLRLLPGRDMGFTVQRPRRA